MTETIFTFAPKRLAMLQQELVQTKAHLADLEKEIAMLTPLVAEIGPPRDDGDSRPQESLSTSEEEVAQQSMASDSDSLTIKEKALAVLADKPTGLTNSQVQSAIQKKFGTLVGPKSLSPQLNRLSRTGAVHKEGDFWKLVPQGA